MKIAEQDRESLAAAELPLFGVERLVVQIPASANEKPD